MREAKRVVRKKHVLITETEHGLVCANSGVDVSNVDGGKTAVLLPRDPDRVGGTDSSAAEEANWAARSGHHRRQLWTRVARGSVRGCDRRRRYAGDARLSRPRDDYGYKMHATEEAVADELACVAGLVCGKRFTRSGLYNPGLRLSPWKRQGATAGASGGEGFVPVEAIPEAGADKRSLSLLRAPGCNFEGGRSLRMHAID